MSSPHVLAATIRHRLGPLSLDVRFSLTAPWTVLFGPSAAGKSTLLRILAGLVKADLAEITGRGESVGGSILVMQDPALFPHLSVERNIAFGLHALDKAARRRRLKAMLALFDLEPLAARMPRSLSGGEQQRVALARALAPAPSLLLLDEPFNALDGALKTVLLGTLTRALAEEHSAVFYVSHDVAEVFELNADVLLLEAGRIVGQGPPEIVLREHRERLLRQLRA